jgi:Chromo (CHRromatin Organisation MOdifier) domain
VAVSWASHILQWKPPSPLQDKLACTSMNKVLLAPAHHPRERSCCELSPSSLEYTGTYKVSLQRSSPSDLLSTLYQTEHNELKLYIVSKILGLRYNEREMIHEFLVAWRGFPVGEATWEPDSFMTVASKRVRKFMESQGDPGIVSKVKSL